MFRLFCLDYRGEVIETESVGTTEEVFRSYTDSLDEEECYLFAFYNMEDETLYIDMPVSEADLRLLEQSINRILFPKNVIKKSRIDIQLESLKLG